MNVYAEIINRQIAVVKSVGDTYHGSDRTAYYVGAWFGLVATSFTLTYFGVKAFKISRKLFA